MLKVLIADDEKLICRLIQALADWEALGMEVVGIAENGIEALEKIKELHPDILITDIRMPGCNGLELIAQAKDVHKDIEVAIISGYAHFEYAQKAIRYGVGSYLLKPIQQVELMETLEKLKKRVLAKKGNQDEQVHQNIQRDLSRLKNSLIRDLLNGEGQDLTGGRMKQYYHMSGNGEYYRAFVMKADCELRKMKGEAYSVLKERTEEVFRVGFSGYCEELLLYFTSFAEYGVVNYSSGQRGMIKKRLRDCLNHLYAQKNLFGSVEFTIAVGPEVEEPENIRESLEIAEKLMEERLLEGTGRLLDGELPKGSGIARQEILDHYAKTMEYAVESLDPEAAAAACGDLEEEIMGISGICAGEILEMVIGAGRFFVVRTGVENGEKIQEDFISACRQCGTIRQLFKGLEELQRDLLKNRREARDNEAGRPIRLAKRYVQQHYQEPITLEDVCEATGFSVSYFSSLFKKETGEGFAKYLTRIRMEEAKTLLRETGLPVTEICEKVGYSDRKHFTHTFKKTVGLNPAEYRKLYG